MEPPWSSGYSGLQIPGKSDRSLSGPLHATVGRASISPLVLEHAAPLWAFDFPHSEEWFLRSPELLMGRASTAPLTTEG